MRNYLLVGLRLMGVYFFFTYFILFIPDIIRIIQNGWSIYFLSSFLIYGVMIICIIIFLFRPNLVADFVRIGNSEDEIKSISKKDAIQIGLVLICFMILLSKIFGLAQILPNLAQQVSGEFEIYEFSRQILSLLLIPVPIILMVKSSKIAKWLDNRS